MERDVLGDREVEHETSTLAVLWDVADPRVERRPCVGVREFVAGDGHRPALDPLQAGESVDELGLTIAVYARDADDLTCPNLEGNTPDLLDLAVVADVEVAHREEHVARLRGLLLYA